MRHEVDLQSLKPYRISFLSNIYNSKKKQYIKRVPVIYDTGCVNTLIPIKYALDVGTYLHRTRPVNLFGKVYNAKLYSIRKWVLNTLEMEYVTMLADDYGYDLEDTILVGANTYNNWLPTPDRTENKMFIEEKFPPQLSGRKFPYCGYFNTDLEYTMLEPTITEGSHFFT